MTALDASVPAVPIATAGSGKLKLALVTLVVVAAAELIGPAQFQVGPGKVVLLPMLWALLIAAAWGLAQRRMPGMVRITTGLQTYAGGRMPACCSSS